MKTSSFEQQAKLIQVEEFIKYLRQLKDNYAQLQKYFDNLCDELDCQPINENYINQISFNLTIYISEMDLINKKIKEISDIIKKIKIEISN